MNIYMSVLLAEDITPKSGDVIPANTYLANDIMVKIAEMV